MSSVPDYFERVGAHFSTEVAALDERDRTNPVHGYMRRVSLETLERAFPPDGRLLEFGYGTGTEAIHLARRGARIVGLDPSTAMRGRAEDKAHAAGVADRCEFRLGSTADTAALAAEFAGRPFDGAFATLGPLNCEPDLPRLARDLAGVLRPGAHLVALIINRNCPWEVALYLARGDFRRAFRRYITRWASLGAGGAPADVWTYSPRSFARAVAPHFEPVELFALPVILPPPYAAPRLQRLGGLLSVLETADEALRGRRLLRGLGDHFEAVMRHVATPDPPSGHAL